MTTPTPNVELLKQTLQHIETHPEDWDQEIWRCGTAMCFAGHAATIAGCEWHGIETGDGFDYGYRVKAVPEDEPNWIFVGLISVDSRAQRILGLTEYEAMDLFAYNNTLDDLRAVVARICDRAEAAKEDAR